jgi:CubicO group peptidase (beta-lactamase class C family)
MKPVLKPLFTIAVFWFAIHQVYAQAIDTATAKKIDALFKQWDNSKSPGCAIGIVRNDSVIYAKCFGMANLEYSIPVTTKTMFEMGSISKQFTAYCIMLLAHEGKLNLDEDIHKYLPWLADFGKKITIKNLLFHTSGIRDQDQLLYIAGTREEDLITQEQLIKLLSKQQTLNFDPGEQYMYSNSGYTLLGEIVRSVTGKSLRKFADSVIFKPMRMTSTHFHDDYTEVIVNRAYPYQDENKIGIVNSSSVGAKGLYTNLEDMSKWAMNFCDQKGATRPIIELMMQKGKLSTGYGTECYGAGIVIDDYRGLKVYGHNGINGGYHSVINFFPKIKMGFIVFSNLGNFDMDDKIMQMNGLFIKDPAPEKANAAIKIAADSILKDTASVKPFLGWYMSDDAFYYNFRLKDKKLYVEGSDKPGGKIWWTSVLISITRDTFQFPGDPNSAKIAFKVKNGQDVTVEQIRPGGKIQRTAKKYDPKNLPSDKQLLAYTGTYYSSELDCNYRIILKDHHLLLTNAKYDDAPLTMYDRNRLLCHGMADSMNSLNITRDKQGKVNGFEVNYWLVQDLRFEKVK